MKKMGKKGFTLAELLIVVAIIAVLVAIAIPVFGAQLEKSKIATDEANVRSWYAEQVTNYLSNDVDLPSSYNGPDLKAKDAECTPDGSFADGTATVTYTADELDEDFVINSAISSGSTTPAPSPSPAP